MSNNYEKFGPEFLSGTARQLMTVEQVEEAIQNKSILEALVIECDDDRTLILSIGTNIEGRIRYEDLQYSLNEGDLKPVSALSKVGKRVKFYAKAMRKCNDKYIVDCTRRELQIDCYNEYISKLRPGDIIPARAIRVEEYGVFCDVGCGMIGLLHTNHISVTHIVNPKESLKNINNMFVVVKEIQENGRMLLTHRELLGTWLEESSKFSMDDIVEGTVLSVEDYGVFVRLSQNLSGLTDPVNIELNPGDKVRVRISMILKNSMKIKLDLMEVLPFEQEKLKFEYRQTSGHMDYWKYSMDVAKKKIETYFN